MEITNLEQNNRIDDIEDITNSHFKNVLFDLMYPVGSYYETSDDSFNPNNEFFGTWEKISDGTVLVSSGGTWQSAATIVGQTIGNNTVTLSRNNIPVHAHGVDNAYTKMYIGSNRIDYQRVGTEAFSTNVRSDKSNSSYYESINEYGNGIGVGGSTDFEILDPDPEGETYPNPVAISVVQPSMVVARWHRTA